jgi:SAM-dependent methyltransferase
VRSSQRRAYTPDVNAGRPPRSTEETITRRLRDRVGRGGLPLAADQDVSDSIVAPGTLGDPPDELLELHERYVVTDIDIRARAPIVGRLITALRRLLLRPLHDLAARQTDVNALTARVLSELWNRITSELPSRLTFLEANAVTRDVHNETIRELKSKIHLLQRRIEELAPTEIDIDSESMVEHFRGDEGAIREHQRRYVERFVEHQPVLDLGCGRGEFLELLREAGITARGVDTDERMVTRCRTKGLQVERRDALAALREVKSQSLGGIFATQLIEHLEPAAVVELVRLSQRALDVGGLLLIESVNPRALINIASFYIDFTHQRFYDAEAITWLLESEGFEQVAVEFSVPVGDEDRLPRLPGAEGEGPRAFDQALERLNHDIYGCRAYAVTGRRSSVEAR